MSNLSLSSVIITGTDNDILLSLHIALFNLIKFDPFNLQYISNSTYGI